MPMYQENIHVVSLHIHFLENLLDIIIIDFDFCKLSTPMTLLNVFDLIDVILFSCNNL
jgi:hypothetical protein